MSLIGFATLSIFCTTLNSVLCRPDRNIKNEKISEGRSSVSQKRRSDLTKRLYQNALNKVVPPQDSYQAPKQFIDPNKRMKSEYFTATTTPPWHPALIPSLELNNLWILLTGKYLTDIVRTVEPENTEEPTENTFGNDKCCMYCFFIDLEQNDSEIISFAYDKGLLEYEEARRCYNHCYSHTCELYSASTSLASENVPTYPPDRQVDIEIVTGTVQEETVKRGRQHCYQTIRPLNVTVRDKALCYLRYKPTSDSPRPSHRPLGLNVWTCCRNITPNDHG